MSLQLDSNESHEWTLSIDTARCQAENKASELKILKLVREYNRIKAL